MIDILIGFFVAIAVGGVLLFLGSLAYRVFTNTRGGASPTVQQAIDAFAPYIRLAIFSGERMVITVLDDIEARIASADKKAVADSVYDIIPPTVTAGKFTFSTDILKRLVPREEFQRLVENAYNTADATFQQFEKFLKDQVSALNLTPLPANLTTKSATVGRSLYGVDGNVYSEIADFADANPVAEPRG